MKTYVVYINGVEVETIKAGSHNSAEKKARKKYPPTEERIRAYMRVNPTTSRAEAMANLSTNVSVNYTEI